MSENLFFFWSSLFSNFLAPLSKILLTPLQLALVFCTVHHMNNSLKVLKYFQCARLQKSRQFGSLPTFLNLSPV